MSDEEFEDGDIEFLDEDAEIVSQCINIVDTPKPVVEEKTSPLLVERVHGTRANKRKKKFEEDTDYDPAVDLSAQRKRKVPFTRQTQTPLKVRKPVPVPQKSEIKKNKQIVEKSEVNRKKLDIRVPDYDDPLCLPVKAIKKDLSDLKHLRSWNSLCIDHFKNHDNMLQASNLETVSSKRTVVLRNTHNKQTGKLETIVWNKIKVENKKGENKSEVVQSILPKYREKKVLNFNIREAKRPKQSNNHHAEAILTKEVHKDAETLIIYKPQESISLVYEMIEKTNYRHHSNSVEDEKIKVLREIASCKICAPCYQTSWRGFKPGEKKPIHCHICKRSCFSVYNLLSHIKMAHSSEEVQKFKVKISEALANIVDYHYRCKICQKRFDSIKELRSHVADGHKSNSMFVCEVGNHVAS